MKWSSERYARLYTRDTSNWVAGPWQARAVLPLVLRKLDRAGTLDLDDNGLEGLAAMIGLPVEVVDPGMAWWAKKGTLVMVGSVLTMPNYVEAQECVADQALRAKDYRDRQNAAQKTPPVTPRDGGGTQRDATVTKTEVASPPVTPCCAVPSLAVPSPPPVSDTRGGAIPDEPESSVRPMAVELRRPQPTLAPTQRTIDPALKLPAMAREAAVQRSLQDIDGAFRDFVAHHIGRGTLSCDFIAGEWPKWITTALKIEARDRTRIASGPARATPRPGSSRQPLDRNGNLGWVPQDRSLVPAAATGGKS